MADNSLQISEEEALAKTVQLPSFSGRRQSGLSDRAVDGGLAETMLEAAEAKYRSQLLELEQRCDGLMNIVGQTIAEMDGRYRRECLSLAERLFAAAAPTLAQRSSMADIMKIIEDRVVSGHAEIKLRIHPSLFEKLSAPKQDVLSQSPIVTLKLDEDCAPAMVDVSWKNGGMFHDPDGLIKDVLNVLREETNTATEAKPESDDEQ